MTIPAEVIPLYRDRLNMFGEVTLSAANAHEIFRGYQSYLSMRMNHEQMADGKASNVDYVAWAKRIIKADNESKRELKYPKRLVKLMDADPS